MRGIARLARSLREACGRGGNLQPELYLPDLPEPSLGIEPMTYGLFSPLEKPESGIEPLTCSLRVSCSTS